MRKNCRLKAVWKEKKSSNITICYWSHHYYLCTVDTVGPCICKNVHRASVVEEVQTKNQPIVSQEVVSGHSVDVGHHGGDTAVHHHSEGRVMKLFDWHFKPHHVSQQELRGWTRELPVIWGTRDIKTVKGSDRCFYFPLSSCSWTNTHRSSVWGRSGDLHLQIWCNWRESRLVSAARCSHPAS